MLNAKLTTHQDWLPITRAPQATLHEWRESHRPDPMSGLTQLREKLTACVDNANLTNVILADAEAAVTAVLDASLETQSAASPEWVYMDPRSAAWRDEWAEAAARVARIADADHRRRLDWPSMYTETPKKPRIEYRQGRSGEHELAQYAYTRASAVITFAWHYFQQYTFAMRFAQPPGRPTRTSCRQSSTNGFSGS